MSRQIYGSFGEDAFAVSRNPAPKLDPSVAPSFTLTEAVNQFSWDPLEQQPGTKLLYSTHGFTLLGPPSTSGC